MDVFCRTLTTWTARRGKCAPQHQELQKPGERSRAGIAILCKSARVFQARAGRARYDFRRGKCMHSNNNGRIGVMLVDMHRILLSGLQRLIDDQRPELHVVATATECAGALELAARAKPDVVVVDVDLATEKDGGLVPSLINGGNTRVLVLSGARDGRHELAILRGACGVVHKDDTPELLIKAIKKVDRKSTRLNSSHVEIS